VCSSDLRASFAEALEGAAWRHQDGGPSFAVICLDLDRFKEVNDSLGHAAGDQVLRQVTLRLRRLVRHGDDLARLGGDEFAVLQSGVASALDVQTLAERIVEVLDEPFDIQGAQVYCGASVGAAIFGVDASDTARLMHQADLALYRAKQSGRGTFSFYDATLDEQLRRRHELTQDLRRAIATDALDVHYQALYAADGETITGYEALLRWQHPLRGAVAPQDFVPLAEDSGLILPLGEWVLRRACADALSWREPYSVSVNLSAAQFHDGDLMGTVQTVLDESGLPPARLELEITESLLMSDTEGVLRTLEQLGALGVRIAMDDFGTGYSSLAYLWRFPFDKVKIDRAFTQGLGVDPKVDLIVRSIISLAHSLKIRVNAEGIETEAQLEVLKRHGCDELQGFLLARPAPVGAIHAALDDADGAPRQRADEQEDWAETAA
jgi:diguanylate cyclase (GGDEF)-like protein